MPFCVFNASGSIRHCLNGNRESAVRVRALHGGLEPDLRIRYLLPQCTIQAILFSLNHLETSHRWVLFSKGFLWSYARPNAAVGMPVRAFQAIPSGVGKQQAVAKKSLVTDTAL